MTYKEKLIYLAGILDGEGCLRPTKDNRGKRRYRKPRCEISNTSKNLIDWLYKNFDGHCYPVKKEGNRKLQYRWDLRHNEMRRILPRVLPYLRIKKKDALKSLKFLNGDY